MTDEYAGFVVVLDKDRRENEAEATIHAIRMIKGVVSVKPILGDSTFLAAEERVMDKVRRKMLDFIRSLDG